LRDEQHAGHRRPRWPFCLKAAGPAEYVSCVVTDLPKLAEALPTLAAALGASLVREGEWDLARQVGEVRIDATCACDDEGCLSLYVAPSRSVPCGEYRAVLPDAVISVGVCGERIEYIEDNALLRDADDTPARSSEYGAVEGTVPTRLPIDL
jgi:hypothetical protein